MKKVYKLLFVILTLIVAFVWKWGLILVILLYLLVRFSRIRIKRLQERFPNWAGFNHNLERNYDYAVVGNSVAYNCYDKMPTKRKSICWALPNQQYFMQEEVLKHFFSIIKTKGKVYLLTSMPELKQSDEKNPLLFHYTILHHWLYPDVRNAYKKINFIWLFSPLWFLKVLHVKGFSMKDSDNDVDANLSQIKTMQVFCQERDLDLVLVLVGKFTGDVMEKITNAQMPFLTYEKWLNSK